MTRHLSKSVSKAGITLNPKPAQIAFVPDLPDEEVEMPQRFRLAADQRNPDLGSALLWGTIGLMGLATWVVIALVLS